MCLVIFAYHVHPSYRLILAANRDEFYDRPSMPADFWIKHPQVLAGFDLKEKGTWLGVTKKGKFAAITNYRDPASWKAKAPSRGKLVSRYLTGFSDIEKYFKKISTQARKHNGFNLLAGDESRLFVYSNRGGTQQLKPGIYGLSNHLLDTLWPKVKRGKKMLKAVLGQKGDELEKALFALLMDRHIPPDSQLPETGVNLEWERILSAIFVTSPIYGTRSSTILLIGKNRRVRFVEKVYNNKSESWATSRFSFLQELEKSRRMV